MHEMLRRRILRRLETLPETQLYQALDYIEFLESKHGETTAADASGLQKLAERLEDGLRKRTFSPTTVREAFQLISVADRLLSSVSEAGREILSDIQDETGGTRRPTEGSGGRSATEGGTRQRQAEGRPPPESPDGGEEGAARSGRRA